MKQNSYERWVAYLQDNPEGYWFKRKLYGYGWTPATKEGWLLSLGMVATVLFLAFHAEELATDEDVLKLFVLPVFVLVAIFIFIVYKKGEKPKWQWGLQDDEKK